MHEQQRKKRQMYRGKNPHKFVFFSDFQKSQIGRSKYHYHTELICIIIGSLIKVMWFSLDIN